MDSSQSRVRINVLPTGAPDLDIVLGGGIPEYSFNVIAGAPGSGKTTLAHQIVFANASADRPSLYFTVLGEPALKMLRYQQNYSFFKPDMVESEIRFINLSDEVLSGDLGSVLDRIVREVEASNPRIVVVDSFRTVLRRQGEPATAEGELQGFVQRLALYLTSWQATTFLVGEYMVEEIRDNPVFTVADGLLWLSQSVERNSVVRKLQVIKLRGQASLPGLHTFRITEHGLQVFPRTFSLVNKHARNPHAPRLFTGVAGLDEMMGGGVPAGDSVIVAGPSGSGKSALATQFIAEGIRLGEPGVIAVFEERPEDYVSRSDNLGMNLQAGIDAGLLKVLYLRPLDLSVDETLREILDTVASIDARRVVIDSMNGFEMALAPAFREDFRESLYRMVGALKGIGVTIMTTVEVVTSFTDLRFTPHGISFLTDDIILLRYIEIESQLRKIATVVKMRGGPHSKDIREYDITSKGMVIGERLTEYRHLITGTPDRTE
ncbi:circadian clock protein KaiC [Capsulimonas corticalis]|uniref:Circadian clock protein KaiC n=1 Tax=Capsulimonas corticalis TaxID=2219043 RepID=A0A402CY23_9BACT|nr:ATPase domain-containing protein [Capsulimonas corticalis]BDI32124.1 circadian clock protein KaiC [Capsulimonas corticalis]